MRLSTKSRLGCTSLCVFALATITVAGAGEAFLREITGPVEARVVKVRDGDTVMVEAFIWPMQSVHVAVRLRGINAPEHRGRCAAEKAAAQIATDRLKELIGDGNITLTDISGGKYFGRVLASLSASTGDDIADRLLHEGLVVRYEAGKRRDWCDGAVLGDIRTRKSRQGGRG